MGIVDWNTIAPVMGPEGQRVLALANPEEAVRLLGQLGRERRQDQREDQRLDALPRRVQKLLDEVGAADDRAEADEELEHDEPA